MAVPSARGLVVEPLAQRAGTPLGLPSAEMQNPKPTRGEVDGPVGRGFGADAHGVPAPQRVAARNRIDGLALGAPVTAAFVGVMLAKGELVGAGAAAEDADIAAAGGQERGDGAGAASTFADPVSLGSGEEIALEDATPEQHAPLDPVAAVAPQDGAGPQKAAAIAPEAPGATAAVEGGEPVAQIAGPTTVNLSLTSLSLDDLLAGEAASGEILASPIAAFGGGAEGDDTLVGSDQRDSLDGGAGNDLIQGLGGDDWLAGGDGNDGVHGGAGNDLLLGGTGDDLLDGGGDDDRLSGGDGTDSLLGSSGDDVLDGGAGDDALDGGSGADRLTGGTGNDTLVVDDRNDLALEQSYGFDGGGWDVLQVEDGFSGSAVTFAFGDDLGVSADGTSAERQQVHGEIENLVLTGSIGHDAIGDGRANSLVGNAGDNALYGGAGSDILQGGAGDDLLDGGLDGDRIEGGAGNDILAGGFDADDLFGGDGNDRLSGDHGADRLYGGAGDDSYLIGLNDVAVDTVFDHEGSNHIVLEGAAGHTVKAAIMDGDLYLVADGNPVAVVDDYVGNEHSFAGVDLGEGIVGVEDLLAGSRVTAPQEPALLDTGPDPLAGPSEDLLASYLSRPNQIGADTADQMSGTSGADWLQGLAGDDTLSGAAGSDVLEGGAGSDLLQGGAGDDRYLFRSGESGLDTIRDAEGSNIAELDGFTGARLEGVVVGHDLIVVADYAPILKVENFVGNEASFAGVQVDDGLVTTDELFG